MENDAPETFLWSGVSTGVKKSGNPDLALAYSSYPATCAAVFTENSFAAAPVLHARRALRNRNSIRGLVVNSGIANAATGEQGRADNLEMIEMAADRLGISEDDVLSASTGHIGERLPLDSIREGLPDAVDGLEERPRSFAEAIMTTDTTTKVASREIPSLDARVCGVAKGAGMIRPDMATMLGFLFLDHPAEHSFWQNVLEESVTDSFNRITVDGQMSTNDTVYALASNRPDRDPIDEDHESADDLKSAVGSVCRTLARDIVSDGEGSTRVITVRVRSAPNPTDAEIVARAVAGSTLVKTAFNGADPNWGRIYSAIGATGIDLDPDDLTIRIDETGVYEGEPCSEETLEGLRKGMQDENEHEILVDLAAGDGTAECWTCDLSEDYVRLNADYHT